MHFPSLGGLGRAEYHQVIPRTNIVRFYSLVIKVHMHTDVL